MIDFCKSPPEEFVFIRNLFCLWFNPEQATFDFDGLSGLDWQRIYELLEQHRLWAAADMFLDTEYASAVPPEYAERIHATYRSCCLQNLSIIGQLISLGKLLDAARIPFTVVKGPLLSVSIHGDINKRFSRDIDILVADSDISRVHELMVENGFIPCEQEGYARDSWIFWVGNKHLTYLNNNRFKIEIHTRLFLNPGLLNLSKIDPGKVYREQEFSGHRFRVFQDDFAFLYLCVHGSAHLWFRLFWLADICAWMSSRSPEQLEGISRLAGRFGCKKAIHSTFNFADYFSGRLECEEARKDLSRFGNIYIRSWMNEQRLLEPGRTLYERFQTKWSIYYARFFFSRGIRLWSRELVRILFAPTQKEFRAVDLPGFFQSFYFVVRPFLLLKRALLG